MREENDLLAGLLLVFYNGLEIKEVRLIEHETDEK